MKQVDIPYQMYFDSQLNIKTESYTRPLTQEEKELYDRLTENASQMDLFSHLNSLPAV